MTTFEKRLMAGMKTLERLQPDWHALRAHSELFLQRTLAQAERLSPRSQPVPHPGGIGQAWPPSLEEVLAQAGPLPPCSLNLGLCEDGVPFTLDLTNPAPGALLITGDPGCGKTRLLRAILASAALANPPDQVSFYLVADRPPEYFDLEQLDPCQALLDPGDPALPGLIDELVELAEERRRAAPGASALPALILALDDLAGCVAALDETHYTRLYWLVRHGPRSRVWTLATLPANRLRQVGTRFLSAFRTRLFGFSHDRRLAAELAAGASLPLGRLESGAEFCTVYGEDCLRIWICEPAQPLSEIEGEPDDEHRYAVV